MAGCIHHQLGHSIGTHRPAGDGKHGYNTVVDKDQIPLASRPRIVKLHGSLPAQFPLIFTEEDYRTYPTEFAPFVNTVQRAMMETVFCLIGFSGNDPNFLHWSGWVRDNLGASAPKIYLAGWLDLSTSQTQDVGRPRRRANRSCTSSLKPIHGPSTYDTVTRPSGCCIRWSEDAPMTSRIGPRPAQSGIRQCLTIYSPSLK